MNSLQITQRSPKTNIVWFMVLVLGTGWLFPGHGAFEFYSVQWSFFFWALWLMYLWALAVVLKGKIYFSKDPVYYFLSLFLLLVLVSWFPAVDKVRWLLFAGRYIPYFFLVYAVIQNIDTTEKLSRAIRIIMVLSLVLNVFVILLMVCPKYILVANNTLINRISATNYILLNTINMPINKIGVITDVPTCIAIVFILKGKASFLRIALLTSTVFTAVIIGSRGMLLTIVLMWLLAIFFSRLNKRVLAVSAIVFAVGFAGFMVSEKSRERIRSKLIILNKTQYRQNINAFSRFYTARISFHLMVTHPLTGVGMGNIRYAKKDAVSETPGIPVKILDYWDKRGLYETTCTPLRLGAEMGIGGFLFFFFFFYYIWKKLRYSHKIAKGQIKLVLTGMKMALIVRFAHEMVDLGFMSYVSWFYFGLLIAASRVAAPKMRRIKRKVS